MASKLFFNGRITSTPSTVSRVDDTAEQPTNLTVGNVLAIVGTCTGGQPNTPLFFGDPNQVDAVLVDGPLAYAVKKAFAPSSETNAPSLVIAMRVGRATPATLTLLDAQGQPSIVLASTEYGLPANQTKVKVETGTVSGLKLTTQVGVSYDTQDNIGRNAFSVQYLGAAASAQISITGTQAVLFAPGGTPVATIALADAPTVAQLVDRIAATPGFVASVSGGSAGTQALLGLDTVAMQDCKTAPFTATANLQACVEWLNSLGDQYATATRPVGAGLPPANMPFTYMAGGTAPAPVFSDWVDALNTLQTSDVQWLVPLSGDPAVHAAVDAHVAYMSTVGRKERRALMGPNAGTSMAAAMALPIALDSDRSSICWPGYYDFNAAGIRTLYDSFYTAVLVAAGFAGSDPGTPMTNKSLAVRGLETKIRNPTDTDQLINAGVLCVEATDKGFKVVRSITTWLQNDNFNRVEVSVGAATDYVVRTVREAVDPLRGGEATPQAIARCNSQTESALIALAVPKPVGPGVIVGDDKNPAFRNIRSTLTGDILAPFFECSPVIPINFVPVTVAIVPYSGTAAV